MTSPSIPNNKQHKTSAYMAGHCKRKYVFKVRFSKTNALDTVTTAVSRPCFKFLLLIYRCKDLTE